MQRWHSCSGAQNMHKHQHKLEFGHERNYQLLILILVMPVLRYHRHKDPSPILNTEWFSWPGLPTTSYRNVIAGRATLGKPTSAMSLPPQPTGTDNAPTNMTKNASQSMTDNDVGYFGDSTNLNGITTVNTSTCNVRIQRRTCRRVRASELDDLYQRM